jgi:hypothetical protein
MKIEALRTEPPLEEFEPEAESHPASAGAPEPRRATLRKVLTLSGLLRGLGGLVIVAAFVVLLFQGWRDGDDLSRYLLLMGHTLVLTLAGFAAGHLLHEGKGARLFIALALIAIPVNFAFLGGISYEQLTWDPAQTVQTALGFWHPAAGAETLAPDLVLSLTGAALPVLGVSIWIGFLVMARRSARPLSGLFLLSNAALLVPTRDTALVSGLLLGLGLLLTVLVVRLRRRDPSLATAEGLFARAILALPLLVMGGRSIWFYAPSDLFFTSLALIGYLGLRQALGQVADDSRWRIPVEGAAVAMAGISTLFAFATAIELHGLHGVFKLPIAGAILAGLLLDLSTRTLSRASLYRSAAVLTATAPLLANLFAFGGFANALVCLVAGIATLGYGYLTRQRPLFVIGLISALTGMGFAGTEAFAHFTIGGWTGLVLLGVATILAGSLIERHGQTMKATLLRWHHHFNESD